MTSDIETRVRESFARQPLMTTIGARVEVVQSGHVELSLAFRGDLTQQNGFLHAGTIAALADSACGYAALTMMPPGSDVLSIEFKINMLAPASGEALIARADVLRAGRTVVVCRADVYARKSGDEKLVAAMQGTMAVRQ
ncbi:MAG TPA: PaaI family thioesterase [Gemmatimonadaceae bacterium]|nr:PaaI family thioesterase [Gemmatimonadaceae bacterium]